MLTTYATSKRQRDVTLDSLRTEQGGGLDYLLAEIETSLEKGEDYDMLVGQHNFELTQSVRADQLRFHKVCKVRKFDEFGGSDRKSTRLNSVT